MSIMTIVIMIVISVGLVVYALLPNKDDQAEAIRRRVAGKKSTDDLALLRSDAKESVASKVVQSMAPFATRPVMPKNAEEMSKLNLKLATAGLREENSATIFLASKTIVAILLGLLVCIYMWSQGAETNKLFGWTVMAAGAGFWAPNFWLSMAANRRMEQVVRGLPDSLDLMVISVESGLALDSAIQRVGDEMKNVHPLLSEEFQIATLESQMGIPRSEALGNMATRTGVPQMRSLVSIVNQAERFGTSIASALRNQADALRVKRRQEAEERAQKTTVKLMAPLILFIFPAIFVVLAGPAALRLIDTMGSTGGL